MIKVVLIWVIISERGYDTASAEFHSLAACETAKAKLVELAQPTSGRTVAFCTNQE